MRGEHFFAHITPFTVEGSSPHARGTRFCLVVSARRLGIIPACAGNTRLVVLRRSPIRDHPRMRGEHEAHHPCRRACAGSSPHARGTPQSRGLGGADAGIIPACAGNTPSGYTVTRCFGDHPRMRGEHPASGAGVDGRRGSSPHARGTLFGEELVGLVEGIIPACAGNTHLMHNRIAMVRDHPRMRGEHLREIGSETPQMGSSPHARGTRSPADRMGLLLGIIPACAGNTLPVLSAGAFRRDHPRMRGEHGLSGCGSMRLGGSSPHARGTRFSRRPAVLGHGIIPACAGNTPGTSPHAAMTRDHPRMRGEHAIIVMEIDYVLGSSPHARGTHVVGPAWNLPCGIIPACAGNTSVDCAGASWWGDHPRMRGEHEVTRLEAD